MVQTESHQTALNALVQLEFDVIALNLGLTGGVVMVLVDYAAYRWPKTWITLLTPVGTIRDGSLFNYSQCLRLHASGDWG